ncbi:MAG: histidine triad nucleotide-binding protein, partial [Nitrospirota bacterium]|nr:histidine triad nucleotide-binding protein [Nitrospirota bacterium]
MSDCLFCRIAAKEIPAKIVYEDDDVVAFRDISPQAPTHILLIPRKHIAGNLDIADVDASLIGKLFIAANRVAKEEGINAGGFRTVFNC